MCSILGRQRASFRGGAHSQALGGMIYIPCKGVKQEGEQGRNPAYILPAEPCGLLAEDRCCFVIHVPVGPALLQFTKKKLPQLAAAPSQSLSMDTLKHSQSTLSSQLNP